MSEKQKKPTIREDLLELIENKPRIDGKLDLSSPTTYENEIDLQGLEFTNIYFHNGRFFRAKFNGSTLTNVAFQNATLEYATFNILEGKPTSVQACRFCGAHLEYAQFRGANLTGSIFTRHTQHPNSLPAYLDNTDFRGANLMHADFSGCRLYGTKLEGTFIRGANLLSAHLEQVDWGNYIIGEETKPEELHFAEDSYRELKNWYTNNGQYGVAAKFYFREREAIRKQNKWFSKNLRHRLALEFMRILLGYGENWERILVWSIAIILGFGIAFRFSGMGLGKALYFSLVSFTALGYGGWVQTPTGWVQTVGAIESLVGIGLMALLLVTFVRKWTR